MTLSRQALAAEAADRRFVFGDRDYGSLLRNYARMHGAPMPQALQVAVLNLQAERASQ